MEKKKTYEAPQLTVVSFKAERGYSASGGLMSQMKFWELDNEMLMSADNGNNIEVYESGNGWNEGSNHFWD